MFVPVHGTSVCWWLETENPGGSLVPAGDLHSSCRDLKYAKASANRRDGCNCTTRSPCTQLRSQPQQLHVKKLGDYHMQFKRVAAVLCLSRLMRFCFPLLVLVWMT